MSSFDDSLDTIWTQKSFGLLADETNTWKYSPLHGSCRLRAIEGTSTFDLRSSTFEEEKMYTHPQVISERCSICVIMHMGVIHLSRSHQEIHFRMSPTILRGYKCKASYWAIISQRCAQRYWQYRWQSTMLSSIFWPKIRKFLCVVYWLSPKYIFFGKFGLVNV